ncbi:hypothetical protein J6590_061669 [Homalodisca vitripennis]|nr:hypothetical protein J6590_061669 [Homalodisca vitripennis]
MVKVVVYKPPPVEILQRGISNWISASPVKAGKGQHSFMSRLTIATNTKGVRTHSNSHPPPWNRSIDPTVQPNISIFAFLASVKDKVCIYALLQRRIIFQKKQLLKGFDGDV